LLQQLLFISALLIRVSICLITGKNDIIFCSEFTADVPL